MGLGRFLFGKNPAKNAMPYLNQVPGQAQAQYSPYINRGNQAYESVNPIYQQMTDDPMGYINEIMRGYKPSEGYQFQQNQLSKGLANTAAAGGFRGTENDQIQQAQLIQGLLGEDMQKWLSQVQQAQGQGLAGQQHIADQGYGASNSLADALIGNLGSQATLAYQGQQQMNQNRAQFIRSLLQAAGLAGGMKFGG